MRRKRPSGSRSARRFEAVEDEQRNRLADQVDLDVFAHALDIADVVKGNADRLVIHLEKQGVLLPAHRIRPRGALLRKPLLQSPARRLELAETEWFKKIVDGIDPEAFHRISGMGGRENHQRRGGQRTDEGKAGKVGHLDVCEERVDLLFREERARFGRAAAGAFEPDGRRLFDIRLQLTEGQRLVVKNQHADHTAAGWLPGEAGRFIRIS